MALRGQEIAALVECLYSRDITDIPGMNADKTAAALTIMAADDGLEERRQLARGRDRPGRPGAQGWHAVGWDRSKRWGDRVLAHHP